MHAIGFEPAIETAYHSFGRWPLRMCLDHIFVRGVTVTEAGVSETARGSDHRPLAVRMRLQASDVEKQ